ncbi:bifunctional adenosylcobinamide kinase/adenosylcobinamide-phosphate guanylyltransferase [Vallitalea pronyensis]|uniref:Adenosylcobinamide kinase n=1 Tax=Vallitalea pronyensis TaxID=1348613 RepID=A0A8J8MNR7_9FIRM|nr:bifunctional adenosylcobinamide kinase/adenosylcobinamide-phosphate guanylyltransferase [Vallitalea pronyensis]QUI25125.1 bifunctional adenosylcobinamide kinase/adenosylcobinamide-phosphate guanylyltransferase [Vallitalea pronyensis]
MRMTVVTGGARSGKSTYAEQLAKERGRHIGYIATAVVTDQDMEERINRHKMSRPKEWTTIEQYRDFDALDDGLLEGRDLFLLDCVTTMVTNLMFDEDMDYDTCSNEAIQKVEDYIFAEIEKLLQRMEEEQKQLIVVTNEVGMGLVPAYRLGSIFRDIAGRVNQYLATRADEVYFMISSIPMKIKGA